MTKIDDKVRALAASGFDVGAAMAPEADAGFGGQVRPFAGADVYWHPVMGAAAHEVHGGILERYLALGGPGPHPTTGERCFGFPLTDEVTTDDGLHRASRFEFGAIFWREHADPIFGALYSAWRARGGETGELGYSISPIAVGAGGRVQHYQRGSLLDRGGAAPLALRYVGPMLGQPALVALDPTAVDVPLYDAGTLDDVGPRPDLAGCFDGQLVLREVTAARAEIALAVTVVDGHRVHGRPVAGLRDRTLYDLCLRRADGGLVTIAAHALYAKADWVQFGLAHATDFHVARRNDQIPDWFAARGVALSAYNNFNDNLRDFVRAANRLHAAGTLDVVWATGDLVDYLFEPGDAEAGPGNFGLLEDLVLGRSPYPRGAARVEELQVPIFTGLGNHDYRKHPYDLAFAVSILGYEAAALENYRPFNIANAEAHQLWGVDYPVASATAGAAPVAWVHGWKHLAPAAAARFVAVDPAMQARTAYYFRQINRDGNYLVRAGAHRLAMLDSRWDAGITTGVWDVFWIKYLGGGTKAQRAFLGNGPPSVGLEAADVAVVERAVAEATDQSLVVLGIHAPLFDIEDHEYAHYFRETEHAQTSRDEIRAFGYAHTPGMQPTERLALEALDRRLASWFTLGEDFFKRGSRDPLLDANVSLGQGDRLLELCLGAGGRAIDLVLEGHVHHNAERGLGRDPAGGHRFFHDYYTENPAAYYPARHRAGMISERAEVRVQVGAVEAVGAPVTVREPGFEPFREVTVPGYAETLNTVVSRGADLADWWHDHRPLFVQTAALGPLEHTQQVERGEKPRPTFQGFRVLLVERNLIRASHVVRASEIKDPTVPLPWEPARLVGAVAPMTSARVGWRPR
ncbi:MAG: hypothetical protein IPL61_30670 [Myxococcales bacterium]|nr:hypothetical protein [Myxococcales bacterium]